ncbi:pentapeptide repeat-containing protein [Streptomyces sp. NPDC052127]|uniref:pentapeptide repeat-containing protein n=1 Tax=Streptomyces sp. NPDC052127 TaxID=3155679 RepID=UPI003435DBFE
MPHPSPAPSPTPPEWPHCGRRSPADSVGCRGIQVPGFTACLAHLNDANRRTYLASLTPGSDIDHRGTTFTEPLLDSLLAALGDPATGHRRLGTARFDSATLEGSAGFESTTFEGDAGFASATFKSDARFRLASFKADVWFESTTFEGSAGFESTTFEGGAGFMLASFQGDAWFESASFEGGAGFGAASFEGGAGFVGASFEGYANFGAASFEGDVGFRLASFKGGAGFVGASFEGYVNFGAASFEGDVGFRLASFKGDAGFESASFKGYANFGAASFEGGAAFGAASFEGGAGFESASFEGGAGFESATFQGAAFRSTTFEGDAGFGSVSFKGHAEFGLASFKGYANFGAASFEGHAGFGSVAFKGHADFWAATFKGDAGFGLATFNNAVGFGLATFAGDAWFGSATFDRALRLGPFVCAGQVTLAGAVFGGPVTLAFAARRLDCQRTRWSSTAEVRLRFATVDFAHAVFEYPLTIAAEPDPFVLSNGRQTAEEPIAGASDAAVRIASLRGVDAAHLVLADVDIAGCLFTGTVHLDQLRLEGTCSFDAVPPGTHWQAGHLVRFTQRRTLAEEHHWRARQPTAVRGWNTAVLGAGHVGPAQLAPVYRALRKAFEDGKNEPGAADFYYGEMEMRRHDRTGTTRAERGLLHGYWMLSGYGLRASRAVGWLAAAMLVTTVLLMGFGLPKDDPKQEATGTVPPGGGKVTFEIDKADPQNPTDERFTGERFEKALNITLNSVVFHSSGQDLTTTGTYIEMASRLTEPVLLGLAVLAVRNRVKR